MAFKTQRTFTHSFQFGWTNEEGEQQEDTLTAVYKTMPRNVFIEKLTEATKAGESVDQATLDTVLVSVEGLTIEDENGKVLEGAEYLQAVKLDPALCLRLNEEYSAGLAGNCRPAT